MRVASPAWTPMRTWGAKPWVRRCSARARWMASAHSKARSLVAKATKNPVTGVGALVALVCGKERTQRHVVPATKVGPGLVADRLDERGRLDDVREHERPARLLV